MEKLSEAIGKAYRGLRGAAESNGKRLPDSTGGSPAVPPPEYYDWHTENTGAEKKGGKLRSSQRSGSLIGRSGRSHGVRGRFPQQACTMAGAALTSMPAYLEPLLSIPKSPYFAGSGSSSDISYGADGVQAIAVRMTGILQIIHCTTFFLELADFSRGFQGWQCLLHVLRAGSFPLPGRPGQG